MFHFGWPMVQGIGQWLGPPYPAVFECVWYTLETLGRLIFYTLYHFVMVLLYPWWHMDIPGAWRHGWVQTTSHNAQQPWVRREITHIGTIDWGFDHIWKHRMGVFNILGDLMFLFFNRPFCYRSSEKEATARSCRLHCRDADPLHHDCSEDGLRDHEVVRIRCFFLVLTKVSIILVSNMEYYELLFWWRLVLTPGLNEASRCGLAKWIPARSELSGKSKVSAGFCAIGSHYIYHVPTSDQKVRTGFGTMEATGVKVKSFHQCNSKTTA